VETKIKKILVAAALVVAWFGFQHRAKARGWAEWFAEHGHGSTASMLKGASKASGKEQHEKDMDGRGVLLLAAAHGKANTVLYFIKAGYNVDDVDYYRNTALHLSAGSGNRQTVEAVVNAGVDPRAKNVNGETALTFAIRGNYAGAVDVVLAAIPVQERNEFLNGHDKHGFTPLHRAVRLGYTDLVGVLLSHGADANVWNGDRWGRGSSTPLHDAVTSGYDAVVDKLLPYAKNIDMVDAEGRTALHKAASRGAHQSVKKLLEAGADKNIQDSAGMTAVEVAQRERQHGTIPIWGNAARTLKVLDDQAWW